MKLPWIWCVRGHKETHKREAEHMKKDAEIEVVLSQAKEHLEVARKGRRCSSLVPGPSDTLTWNLSTPEIRMNSHHCKPPASSILSHML